MKRPLSLVSWLTVFFSATEMKGESRVVCSPEPVTAEVKKDVILRCCLEPRVDVTHLTLEWTLNSKLVHLYRSQRDDLSFQDPKFKGRTSLFHKEMIQGNISLKLIGINQGDAGTYTCKVPKLSNQFKVGTVSLNVGPLKDHSERVASTSATSASASPSPSTYKARWFAVGPVLVLFLVVIAVIGCLFWKCRGGNDPAGQRQNPVDVALRNSHSSDSDAEPRGSPLRQRSAAKTSPHNSETSSNSSNTPP